MMNDSTDQYDNQKLISAKMLMDCIQFAVVIRANTQADTYRTGQQFQPCQSKNRLTLFSVLISEWRLAEEWKQEKRTR